MSDTAHDQAIAQAASICAMVAALTVDYDRLQELRDESNELESPEEWRAENPSEAAELADLEEVVGDCADEDDARRRIQEDALSVEYRSAWQSPGEELTPSEFRIVLCTGGPHVEIVGDIDHHGEPCSPRILYKDWGTSGELFDFDHEAVLTYCREYVLGGF